MPLVRRRLGILSPAGREKNAFAICFSYSGMI